MRGHWSIENRLHHVRDVSYDEDRCRVRTGHLPRNLACLTNLAISIVRLKGRFDSIPQAHRHYARRPQDAVRQPHQPAKSLSPTRPRTLRAWPHHRANVRRLARRAIRAAALLCIPLQSTEISSFVPSRTSYSSRYRTHHNGLRIPTNHVLILAPNKISPCHYYLPLQRMHPVFFVHDSKSRSLSVAVLHRLLDLPPETFVNPRGRDVRSEDNKVRLHRDV